jgi:diguanylate cyclase (GGDEF)-like protein
MTALVPMLASSGPIVAGWTVHAVLLTRRLRASRRDPVTGLPTRAAWTRQAHGIVRDGRGAVVLLDLDKFKEVNDTYGHAAGDAVLRATAARLRAWTDHVGGGACGRLGGDEFAVATRRIPLGAELWELMKQLIAPVALPAGLVVTVGASIGVAPDPFADLVCSGLPGALGAADEAMYRAKRSGGGWRYATTAPARHPAPTQRARHHGPAGAGVTDPGRR